MESALNGLQFEAKNDPLLGKLCGRRGLFAFHLGKNEQAKQLLEKSAAIAKRSEQAEDEAYAHNVLGEIAYARGAFATAATHYRKGLTLYESLRHSWGMATSINHLGNLAWTQGEYEQAKEFHEKNLVIRKETGDHWGIATSLNNLGAVARMMAAYNEAHQFHLESLAIRREIGDRLGISYSLNNLGDTALLLAEVETARHYFQEAIQTAMNIEALPVVVYMLVGMATLLVKEKKAAQALELLSFVQNHPASGQDTQDRTAQLLSQLRSDLSAKKVKNASGGASDKSLEAWVKTLT